MLNSRTVSFSDEIRARAPLFTTSDPLLQGRLQPPQGGAGTATLNRLSQLRGAKSGVTSRYGDDGRSDVAGAISDQMILTGAAGHLSHEHVVRLRTRPPSRLPRLVLGDGGVDLGFLDLLGGCAVSQGLQHAVFVHRNHDSGFATESDDVVTAVL